MTSTLSGNTFDAITDNLAQLKQLFPEAFSEDTIDFDKLKMILSDHITSDKESYSFTRGGKRDALKLALAQTTGTLRPDRASSKNRDTTENLYIQGDNLEVLRVLQESYRGQVKMIYIDPPYNTGKDFVYKDDFHDNIASYKDKMDENLKSNPETNGRYHTDWLNMMYPRLKLARNLLKDDGVIFISIDDHEAHNLRKIADEIFGEENFITELIIKKSTNGMGDKKGFSKNHEYCLVYQKSELSIFNGISPSIEFINKFNKEDSFGKYKMDGILMKKGEGSRREDSPTLFFPIYYNNTTGEISLQQKPGFTEKYPIKSDGTDGRWTRGKDKIENESWKLFASNGGTIYIKDYKTKNRRMKLKSILENSDYLTDRATNEIKKIFTNKCFDTPKPIELIKHFTDNILDNNSNDIILDFFSGSATTAHAVMALNAEDGGNRKYIMVQIPETTAETSEAHKAGYTNICEIGKERIRRAGEKIKEEHKDKEGIDALDIGFKCFTLDSTNLKKRDINPENINETLLNYANPIKNARSTEDMLYEIMLKTGLELTTPVQIQTITDKTIYIVGGGSLIVCLDTGITLELIQSMIALEPEMMQENSDTRSTIVLYDTGFATDADKTNAVHQIERAGCKLLVI